MGFRCVPESKLRVLIGGWFRTHFWELHRHSSPSRGNQRDILGRLAYELIIVFGYVPVPFRHTESCRMLRSGKVIVGVDTHKHIHVAVAINQHGTRLGDHAVTADSGSEATPGFLPNRRVLPRVLPRVLRRVLRSLTRENTAPPPRGAPPGPGRGTPPPPRQNHRATAPLTPLLPLAHVGYTAPAHPTVTYQGRGWHSTTHIPPDPTQADRRSETRHRRTRRHAPPPTDNAQPPGTTRHLKKGPPTKRARAHRTANKRTQVETLTPSSPNQRSPTPPARSGDTGPHRRPPANTPYSPRTPRTPPRTPVPDLGFYPADSNTGKLVSDHPSAAR